MNRQTFLALCAAVVFTAAPAIAAPDTPPLSDGVIKKLDPASGKITIAHGPIANLNMMPMTMRFKAETPSILKTWKEGDKIRFRAVDAGGVLTVTSIEAAK